MKLRKWTQLVLIIIAIMSVLVIMSECESTITFIITHFIAVMVLIGTTTILFKYGR